MDQLSRRDLAFNGVEEADELLVPMTLHAPSDHRPAGTFKAANSVVVPFRL